MPPFSFPIWVIFPTESGDTDSAGDLLLAFSSIEKMAAHLSVSRAGHWGTGVIRRHSVFLLVSDLHSRNRRGIHLDPEMDGTGGAEVTLPELLAMEQADSDTKTEQGDE